MNTHYVYYDKKTGKIKGILEKKKRGRGYYIECTSKEIEGHGYGDINLAEFKDKYIVAYSNELETNVLMDSVFEIDLSEGEELIQIPHEANSTCVLELIFRFGNTLEVIFNPEKINPLYNTNFKDKLKIKGYREIRLILKEKDSGNLLVEYVIDARELLKKEKLTFKMLDHIYKNNVDFFTYKVFDTYSWRRERDRFVYYIEKTGEITDIIAEEKEEDLPYIKCDIEEVIGFLDGSKGTNGYVVAYNKDLAKHVLMKKDNIIRLRKIKNELIKIPYIADALSDLLIVYYSDNVLEVSLDVSRIAPTYQTNFKEDVKFENGTEIRLTIKEKDSGNLLVEYIIDAQELLESGQMFFELYDHIYPDNVEFFTYPMFESYSWYKGKVKLLSPIKEKIKFDIQKADTKMRSKDFDYHLIVEDSEKGIKIINNIDNLKQIRLDGQIEFFVVDKHDPNILHGKFALDNKDLKNKVLIMPLDCDLQGKSILYNHKYISVLLKG